jgi:hypothetical protein
MIQFRGRRFVFMHNYSFKKITVWMSVFIAEVASAAVITSPRLDGVIKSISNVEYIRYTNNMNGSSIKYLNGTGYLCCSKGLFSFDLPLTAESELTQITVGNLSNVVEHLDIANGVLHVNKEMEDGDYAYNVDDSNYGEYWMTSADGGLTWTDKSRTFIGSDNLGEYMAIPHHYVEYNGRTYCDPAGENCITNLDLYYLDKDNDKWISVSGHDSILESGEPTHAWDLYNGIAVGGGEGTALDFVILMRAVLDDDGISWITEPYVFASTSDFTLPSGTNFLVTKANPLTGTFLIGAESGGIYRITEQATKLEIIGLGKDNPECYPYIRDILYPSIYSSYALAAGFDLGKAGLVWSSDDGETWTDLSSLLSEYYEADADHCEVSILCEDPNGKIIIGVLGNREGGTLTLLELKLPNPLNNFDAAATHLGSGWQYSPTLGYVWGAFYPWIWSNSEKAWIYAQGDISSEAWLYDEDLAWLWTSANYYPWMWDYANERWIYFLEANDSGRTFYDAKSKSQFSE